MEFTDLLFVKLKRTFLMDIFKFIMCNSEKSSGRYRWKESYYCDTTIEIPFGTGIWNPSEIF